MRKKHALLLSMAGVALVAASQTQAQQVGYSDQDLLLNFRDLSSTTPPNVEVDLGNVASFVSSVAALPGGTAVLDIAGATPGYTTQFDASGLLSSLGTPSTGNLLGFSADATQSSSATLWLTRQISGPNLTGTGLTPSARQSQPAQTTPSQQIGDIGLGYNGGTQLGTGNAATVSAGNAFSYYSQTVDGSGSMTYKGTETTTPGAGGYLEGAQDGSGNVYMALWEVPVSVGRSGGAPDTYEGYFTFQPNGEVDFTTVATPEPSTYFLIGGAGVLALVFRRRITSATV